MDKVKVLEEVKRSIEIEDSDTELDLQLTDYINRISQQLRVRLNFVDEVPEVLTYIVVECAVSRFNRKGDEGMTSYSQEGQSINYKAMLAEYEADIANWIANDNKDPYEGIVRLL